jgi:hypothetical protein
MANLVEILRNKKTITTKCYHPTFCGTVSKDDVIWDVYTLGFCAVATNGKEQVVLNDAQLESFVSDSKFLAWVVN